MKLKKGIFAADTSIWQIMLVILLIVSITFFTGTLYSYSSDSVEIKGGVDKYMLMHRFLVSDSCFTQVQPEFNNIQAIDWNMFTNESLEHCYNVNPDFKGYGFRLTLDIEQESKSIQTSNFGVRIGRIEQEIDDVFVYYKGDVIEGRLSVEVWDV